MEESVLQEWVTKLPLKMQTCLITAIRGGDGLAYDDLSKPIIRALRGLIVKSTTINNNYSSLSVSKRDIEAFCEDIDRYIVHFVSHLYQAIEVVGYKHPDFKVRNFWLQVYISIVAALCLKIEKEEDLDRRLR